MWLKRRSCFAAAKHAGIREIAEDSADGRMVPHLSGSGAVAQLIEVCRNALRTVSFVHIAVEDHRDNCCLCLIDRQLIAFVLALVDAAAFDQVICLFGSNPGRVPED